MKTQHVTWQAACLPPWLHDWMRATDPPGLLLHVQQGAEVVVDAGKHHPLLIVVLTQRPTLTLVEPLTGAEPGGKTTDL